MAKILDRRGRQVWDSRGRATVEAEVLVGRGTTALAAGRAIAPAGASTGSGDAKALEAAKAVDNINTRIRDALRTMSAGDQEALDRRLIEPSLMSADEIAWLDAYHRRVRETLGPDLDGDTRAWLDRATRPLG